MTTPRALVGCSGWSYATWRPKFYPEGMKSKDFLAFYATKFTTIEINYTFNHLPTEKNVAEWTAATSDDFVFGLKASQQITHRAQDDDRLAMFLAALPRDVRCVLEVRDPSWYTDEVYDLLRTANVALVHAEGEKAPSPIETLGRTADFAYVRLRARKGYDDDAVDTWAARLRGVLDLGKDTYAYFRHDDDGSNALSAVRLRGALA